MENNDNKNNLISDLLKRISEDHKNLDNYFLLGKLYVQEQNYDMALAVYEKILEMEPLNPQALINCGSLLFLKKDYEKATNFYARAAETEANNFSVCYNLGNA